MARHAAGRAPSPLSPGSLPGPSGREALEIAVGAILTQNTAWSNVEKAIEAIHGAGAMDAGRLRSMPARRLERLVRSSGYFRQKAARLKVFLREAARRGGLDAWLKRPRSALREELLSVSGIGPETADSIVLYAAAKPSFVVDAYTLRIGERLGWFPIGDGAGAQGRPASYETAQSWLVAALPFSGIVYNEFHALVVMLGKLYCRKEPLCGHCPLRENCRYAAAPSSPRRP